MVWLTCTMAHPHNLIYQTAGSPYNWIVFTPDMIKECASNVHREASGRVGFTTLSLPLHHFVWED